MTREEILAMESSELRIEVAEKIFHAKVIGKEGSNPPQFLLIGDKGAGWMPLSGERWQNASWRNSEEEAWNDCSEYGESISAAWEVEEVSLKNGHPQLCRYIRNLSDVVGLEMDSLVGISRMVHATPEQRCKAALIAVMEGQAHETN